MERPTERRFFPARSGEFRTAPKSARHAAWRACATPALIAGTVVAGFRDVSARRGITVAVLLLCATVATAQTTDGQPVAPGAPGGTRLLFGPSGRMLEPGRGYVTFDGLWLASVNVGVTPWLSMGGGMPVIPAAEGGPPFWVIPKARLLSRGATSIALCAVHAVIGDEGRLGALYLVSTTGTAERSFTIGGALAYFHDDNDTGEDYTGAGPALLVGGERRIHPRWSFVTENYLHIEGAIISAGLRLHRRRFIADFGAVAPSVFADGVMDVFPTVSLGWRF